VSAQFSRLQRGSRRRDRQPPNGAIECKLPHYQRTTMADIAHVSERSLAVFDAEDLRRLSEIARKDVQRFIAGNPAARAELPSKILCVALCQGAALHYVDKTNGVKDIDVWTFFADDGRKPWPDCRKAMPYDFGPSKFGRHPDDLGYTGRCVDCLGKSIAFKAGMSPIEALQHYLRTQPTGTAYLLAQKAAVVIDPVERRGQVVWPLQASRS